MEIQEQTRIALATLFPLATYTATPAGAEDSDQSEGAPRGAGVLATDFSGCGGHLDVLCLPDQVVDVARIMDDQGFFLEAVSGVDWIDQQQLEIVYDYNRLDGQQCRVVVRTRVSRDVPVVPTITHVFSAADWHERETFDFYGVQFQGHPNLIRILLPEDADFYPLLKDFMP